MQIKVTIEDDRYEGGTDRKLDPEFTNFIWVDTAEVVANLCLSLIPESPRGSDVQASCRELFFMKSVRCAVPTGLNWTPLSMIEAGDTHQWGRLSPRVMGNLHAIERPLALVKSDRKWLLLPEEIDSACWTDNILDYVQPGVRISGETLWFPCREDRQS